MNSFSKKKKYVFGWFSKTAEKKKMLVRGYFLFKQKVWEPTKHNHAINMFAKKNRKTSLYIWANDTMRGLDI